MSIQMGTHPAATTALAVATYVIAGIATKLPSGSFANFKATVSALVPLLVATQAALSYRRLTRLSNFATDSLAKYCPLLATSTIVRLSSAC